MNNDLKIAVSFSGKAGYTFGREGYGKLIDLNIVYNHIKKHLIEKYKTVDIFIHSWDEELKNYISEVFKPKRLLIEKQKYFGFNIENLNRDEMNDEEGIAAEFRTLSQAYGRFKSIELVRDYENQFNFFYDFVLVLRLDSIITDDIDFYKLDKNAINLAPKVSYKLNGKIKVKKYDLESHEIFGIIDKLNLSPNSDEIRFKIDSRKLLVDSSFIIILSTKLINKDILYQLDNYKINSGNKNIDNLRPFNTFSLQSLFFRKNKTLISLSAFSINLLRRHYYSKEKTYSSGKISIKEFFDENVIKENWSKYKNFYLN